LRVALCQINAVIADFEGNRRRIVEWAGRAAAGGAEVAVFPEMTLTGYPPRDLLERPSFVQRCRDTMKLLIEDSRRWPDLGIVVGSISANPDAGKPLFNEAWVIRGGQVISVHRKTLLPNYDVFDEDRYFEPAAAISLSRLEPEAVGVTICEDIWNDKRFWEHPLYATDPVEDMKPLGPDLHVNISASPWTQGKARLRERMMGQVARQMRTPLVCCNLVGGNDGLVFDGGSAAFDARGRLVARGESFREDFWSIELPGGRGAVRRTEGKIPRLRRALVLALSDYAGKCGFSSAVLGLSGGIDSAVTAALAVEALGPARVTGVAMPGPYSSEGSLRDARELARRLGIRLLEISIVPIFEAYREALAPAFGPGDCAAAEENIQARVRGAVLMALSNRFGHLVLSTGNKSEIAAGYCTLYGDMAGGYALLSDVPKTLVYELARDLNRDGERIPAASISKEPSAELRPHQKDSDALPSYPVLDLLIEALVDRSLPVPAAARRAGVAVDLARDIARRLDRNEYKRRQMPPGPKVTARAFGEGRRYPIAQKFEV
jgi:NAD+ synthetase